VDDQLLATLKALSDKSRLRIVGLLATRPYAVEELACALEISPGTVVHHLKRLASAGFVQSRPIRPYVEYSLNLEPLRDVGRRLGAIGSQRETAALLPGPDGNAVPAFDAKVLRTFVVDGHLISIPAHEKKRQVVLRYLLDRCFDEDRAYPESEVNDRLSRFHPDVAALRRYLVGARMLSRESGVYRLAKAR
jgi:DNA-binding HxlR family transcriptional regulator